MTYTFLILQHLQQMEKRPRRQIKFKNLFQQNQDNTTPQPTPPAPPAVPTTIPTPNPPPKAPEPIQHIPQPTPPPAPSVLPKPQPQQFKPMAPPTQSYRPVEPEQTNLRTRPMEITRMEEKPKIHEAVLGNTTQPTEKPQVEATDKKRSKIEELKSKYLKKNTAGEQRPQEIASSQQTAPQPLPVQTPIVQQPIHKPPPEPPVVHKPATSPPAEPVVQAPIIPTKPESSQSPPTKPDPPISNAFQQFLQSAASHQNKPQAQHISPPRAQEIEMPMRSSPVAPPPAPIAPPTPENDVDNREEVRHQNHNQHQNPQAHTHAHPSRPGMGRRAPPPPPGKPRRQFAVYKEKESSPEGTAPQASTFPTRDIPQPPALIQSDSNIATRDIPSQAPPIQQFAPSPQPAATAAHSPNPVHHTASAPPIHIPPRLQHLPEENPLTPLNKIRHTISMVESYESPNRQVQYEQRPSQNFSTISHLDLLSNIPNLIKQIYEAKLIDRVTYESALTNFTQGHHPAHFSDNTLEYQFTPSEDLSSPWLKEFFEAFILNSKQIEEPARELTYRFICHAFHIEHPNCPLTPAYLVSLVKLSPDYYLRHQQELLLNILEYLPIVKLNSHYLSERKIHDFLAYVNSKLGGYYAADEYCRVLLHVILEYPQTFTEELLMWFNKECRQFGQAAIMYLFLKKHAVGKQLTRGAINNLSFVVNCFEDNGLSEQSLTLLDMFAQSAGAAAYPVLREIRSRVVSKIDAREEERKDRNSGGVFGGLFNQALKFINAPVKQSTPSTVTQPQQQPPIEQQKRQDIYYDKSLGRYVIRGQVPTDEQQQQQKQENVFVPPPPPKPVHHRHEEHSNGHNRSMELNRAVGTVPPPPKKNSRLPQNRYV